MHIHELFSKTHSERQSLASSLVLSKCAEFHKIFSYFSCCEIQNDVSRDIVLIFCEMFGDTQLKLTQKIHQAFGYGACILSFTHMYERYSHFTIRKINTTKM